VPTIALTARARRNALVALTAGAFVAGVGFGALHPLIALLLEARGHDRAMIGFNATLLNVAILIGGPFVPRVARKLGALRALGLTVVVDVVILVLYPSTDAYWAWCVFRFLGGLVGVLWWVVTESWINLFAQDATRTRVVAVYTSSISLGMSIGPLSIAETGIEGWLPWMVVLVTLVIGSVPILGVARAMPTIAHDEDFRALALARRVPVVMIAAIAAGFADLAIVALLPLYGTSRGLAEADAATLLSAFTFGNVVLQYPIAWFADKVSRRAALFFCGACSLAGALLLPLVIGDTLLTWAVLFGWGGTVFAIYMVALGMLGASFRAAELVAANAAFIVIYNVGGAAGPFAAGALMDAWAPEGLTVLVAVASAIVIVATIARREG
jgi:MFS family permease